MLYRTPSVPAPPSAPWWLPLARLTLKLPQTIQYSLENHAWYRAAKGGHWELWFVEPCHGDLWHHLDRCTHETHQRPPCTWGTPHCEEWATNGVSVWTGSSCSLCGAGPSEPCDAGLHS